MTLTQLIVLSGLQAVAEVFPLGSEGHSALISHVLHWPVPEGGLGVPAHLGFLLAILVYFWRDVGDIVVGVLRAAKGKRDPGARLASQIAVAAIPTIGFGVAFELYVAGLWQTPRVMGWAIVAGGVLLVLLDRMSMTVKRVEHASYADAIVISLCQVLALIPGVGSAAAPMIMARLLGFERAAAARFAFLLMVPVMAAVAARDAYAHYNAGNAAFTRTDLFSAGICFVAGLIAFAVLMAWLKRSTFLPFAIYRMLLGGAVLALAYEWIVI